LEIINNPDNFLYLSHASVWEMQIKLSSGKMTLRKGLLETIELHQKRSHFFLLPIEIEHILALDKLPEIHKDPFDRLLIAQAVENNWAVLSVDQHFPQYPIQVIY
jgi:PIN domain nuclease of toxin-antitoxin system